MCGNSRRHQLIGIGVGPGSSDILTVRAVRAIKQARTVFCPKGKRGPGIAYSAAKEWIPEETPVIELDFPMITERNREEIYPQYWEKNAALIAEKLQEGDAVFLTLGDPMVYSTYSYITDYLNDQGIETENIPGIPSFIALANAVNVPLVQGDESFAVLSVTQDLDAIRETVREDDNLVLMKVSSRNRDVARLLREEGLTDHFICVSNLGSPEEEAFTDINRLEEKIPYLSTILIKKNYDFRK